MNTNKWRPISEADACTPYLLWCTENGMVCGFYYDCMWQALMNGTVIELRPTHFKDTGPTPEEEANAH